VISALLACGSNVDARYAPRDPVRGVQGVDTGEPPPEDTGIAPSPTWSCLSGETMAFDPDPVDASEALAVSITGEVGYVYVDLAFSGPGTATVTWAGVTGDGPYTWNYGVTGLSEGTWTARFTSDNGANEVCTATIPVTGTWGDDGSVSVSGDGFVRDGAAFRFVGFNARGLSHYGGGDILPYTSEADIATTLDAVEAAGGTVLRVFAANHDVSDQVASARLGSLLDACEARGLVVIAALTDEYATGFSPQGDDGAYAVDGNGYTVLTDAWYAAGYQEVYRPWVATVVAENAGHPALFGWEPGNETKSPAAPDTWLAWLADVAGLIRRLDPDTPVVAGTIDVSSTFVGSVSSIASVVDVMTVHLYDGATSSDLSSAASLGVPIVVEEAGFSAGDRAATMEEHAAWAFGEGADGYMQWGLMATASDNGDGDRTYGMDRVFHEDWDALTAAYAGVAGGL
jgi:hypothetical protein